MKGKSAGGAGAGVGKPAPPQQAIFSRLSFLHQASSVLPSSSIGLSRYYTSHLLSVSRKSVQRLSPAVKHTICKRCSSLLLPGITSTTRVENKSKNGKKPWADVVVVTCGFCGCTKRFPALDKEEMKARKDKKKQDKEIQTDTDDVQVSKDVIEADGGNDAVMTGT
ncbi:hypothetical protein TWF569_003050 [Orbilia oligospora]|uniref:Rpr2-domain-containing protein n=1 Tax=Orbilia oligospora TaxID=2813651 RepID=A0A7C8NWI1_ORBOL|nr:hypothetical protein TWF102_003845 [Orbilia oligospora]KAF3081473.1 hypothetical protein TWF103_003720 [Orbilia oligospora]KAF3104604.1 hypothetical protein TWF706_004405 [Orbilia oligospora]KAF3120735.1 hypothetical protein TWF569_003050 [Orbilia oligospora]KAF3124688.1 hypothetical protein TWF594_001808 [Orbilia oligospora]